MKNILRWLALPFVPIVAYLSSLLMGLVFYYLTGILQTFNHRTPMDVDGVYFQSAMIFLVMSAMGFLNVALARWVAPSGKRTAGIILALLLFIWVILSPISVVEVALLKRILYSVGVVFGSVLALRDR
jgi:hypothetical protein